MWSKGAKNDPMLLKIECFHYMQLSFSSEKEELSRMLEFSKRKFSDTFVDILLEVLQWVTACVVLCGVICEYIYKADLFLFVITGSVFGWAIVQKVKHPTRRRP